MPAEAPAPQNCFKHFCWRAWLSLAGRRSRRLPAQSDVSGTESDAEDAAGKPNHRSGILVQPLQGPREHPGPDTHCPGGNRAQASPCAHLPPATRRRCCRARPSREQEQPSPSQTWLQGCLEISLACSKRCEWKINLNNYCPLLAWPRPCPGLPRTRNVHRSRRTPQPPPRAGLRPGACAQPVEKAHGPAARLGSALRLSPLPVHKVNEVGRAIQCALAETDKPVPLLEPLCWY